MDKSELERIIVDYSEWKGSMSMKVDNSGWKWMIMGRKKKKLHKG